jgi:hypothetical protein
LAAHGPWIVGGGWLTIAGKKVGLLYRPVERIVKVIHDCWGGRVSADHQPGHPHGFRLAIRRNEIQIHYLSFSKAHAKTA